MKKRWGLWRPFAGSRGRSPVRFQVRNHRTFSEIGEYAGRAVYRPRDRSDLKPDLYPAIGQTVELEFAGVAQANERFAGQNLYRERAPSAWLPSSFIPEEDLEFLD